MPAPQTVGSAIFESALDAIVVMDHAGRILEFNPAAERTFGHAREAVVGRELADVIVPPDQRDAHRAGLTRYLETGVAALLGTRAQVTAVRRDGSEFEAELSVTRIAAADPPRFAGHIRDLTGPRRAENAARRAGERLAEAQRLTQLGSWEIDQDSGVVTASDEHLRLHGMEPGAAIAGWEGFLERIHPADRDVTVRAFAATLATGCELDHHYRLLLPDGERIVHARAWVQTDEAGRALRLLGTGQDVTRRKRAEQEQALLASIVSSSDDAISGETLDGIIVSWNAGAERLYGYRAEEVIGRHFGFLVPETREDELAAILAAIAGGELVRDLNTERVRRDGTTVAVTLTVSPLRDEQGAVTGASVIARDIRDRLQAERQLRAQAFVLDRVDAAVVAVDDDMKVLEWNSAAERLYGWTRDEAVGTPIQALRIGATDREEAERIREEIRTLEAWEGEFWTQRKDGERFLVGLRLHAVREYESGRRGFIGVFQDVTARVADQQRLEAALSFLEAVTEQVADGLFTLDLEGHLTYMNPAATRMLGWTEEQLRGRLFHELVQSRPPDVPEPVTGPCPIMLTRTEGTPVQVDDDVFVCKDGTLLPVSYSAAPFASDDGERGAVVVFNDISERKARELELQREMEALTWVSRIRDALDHDRFVLYAQPIIDVHSGDTVRHELLIRMIGDDGAPILPGEFLPSAEHHGMIGEIDRWVICEGIRFAAEGHDVQLNISGDSLADIGIVELVADRLDRLGVCPAKLVFEITETALIENETAAREFAERLNDVGCGLALDDFGTGYGGFTYLKQLPIQYVKIDREFIGDLVDHEGSRHVVDAIVSLGQGFGAQTVAEGIEDQATLDLVRQAGVDFAQGYLISRPYPAGQMGAREVPARAGLR